MKLLPSIVPAVLALFTAAEGSADTVSTVRLDQAVNRSVALLQKSLAEYPTKETCFSCHHQGVGLFAISLARGRGYAVDAKIVAAAVEHTQKDLRTALAGYRKGEGQPGAVTRAGYAMLALQSGGAKPDEVTAAVSGYLLQRDKDREFWHHTSSRPPQEASSFTDTFLAMRALNAYGEETQRPAIKARVERARQWLSQATPKDTEDRVFQLWALKEAGAEKAALNKAAGELLSQQREDGGWAQLPEGASDAYATGSALTVLRLAGGLSTENPAYQRGVRYLMETQLPDGSWHVVSRSKPFQPYFETGFPHGKDQFISMAATGWATAALVLGSPMREAKMPSNGVEKLGWIAGHWSMEKSGKIIEEHWMRPAGNTMIGMGRTVANGKTVEFEYLRLEQEGDDIYYVAQPNGREKTPFKLVRSSDTEAVFENLKHDFPQRVLYRKQPDGSVSARIEGDVNGKTKGVDFPYKRAKCAASEE